MQSTRNPSQAQGAQISLQTFSIPEFPPTAAGLKALTLTSQIPIAQYQGGLAQQFSVPDSIPYGIESLTLELFSLGYPEGFLTRLAERLPNLKSVVIYSQLFSGTTDRSQEDAIEFFKRSQNLRALHLLDVFAKPRFFDRAAPWLKYNTSDVPGEARRGLMFLEINYTYDHDDADMMTRISAHELGSVIGPGLISCSLNISPLEDENGRTAKEGIMAFNQDIASGPVRALATTEETYPRALKALNLTLFTISLGQLRSIVDRHPNLTILNVTISLEPGVDIKRELIAVMKKATKLEQLEVVGHPTLPFLMQNTSGGSMAFHQFAPGKVDLEQMTSGSLKTVKVNILRSTQFGGVEYKKNGAGWQNM